MLKLESLSKNHTSFWVVDDEFTIGQSLKNQMIVKSENIQEFHAKAVTEGKDLFIIPVDGSSLININNKQIFEKTLLNLDDVVSFAGSDFKLTDPSAKQKELQRINNPFNETTPKKAPKEATLSEVKITESIKNSKHSIEWKIQAINNNVAEEEINIEQRVKLGRDPTNDYTLKGTHVSRKHAELYINKEQLIVKDLNSANGTFVNGDRIKEKAVYLGDELRFDTDIFKVIAGRPATINDNTLNDKTQFRPVITESDLKSYKTETKTQIESQNKPQVRVNNNYQEDKKIVFDEKIIKHQNKSNKKIWYGLTIGFLIIIIIAIIVLIL